MKSYGVTIQVKATEEYFPVVLFIILHKVVLTIFRWYCLSLYISQGCFFLNLWMKPYDNWELQMKAAACHTFLWYC